jgi:hypothetical protein
VFFLLFFFGGEKTTTKCREPRNGKNKKNRKDEECGSHLKVELRTAFTIHLSPFTPFTLKKRAVRTYIRTAFLVK